MNKPTGRYDPDADAISVRFRPEGSRDVESEDVAQGLVLDYDQAGRVIGTGADVMAYAAPGGGETG